MIIPVLMYHSVEQQSDDYLTISCEKFNEQISYLSEYHKILTVRDVLDIITRKESLPENPVIITFDDSLKNNILYAISILDKYSAKATFFTIASYIGKDTLWNHKADKILKHMSADEIKQLHLMGHEVGNHTLTHQRVTKLSDEQLIREFVESKAILTNLLGQEPVSLAYPYGGVNQRCADISRKYFKACFSTVTGGYFDWTKDMANIRRIYVSPNDGKRELQYKILCYLGERQHE